MTGHYQNDDSRSWIDDSQDTEMYLGGQHDSYDDNEGGGDNDDSIMIDPALQT